MSWLQEIVDEFSRGGLRNFRLAVEELEAHATRTVFREHPEQYAQLLKVSSVDALHRTLKGGHPDELGWAELEDACRALGGQPLAFAQFPYLILTNGDAAVVFDTVEPLYRHELDLPEGARLVGLHWSEGQLQVAYVDEEEELRGYWSGDGVAHPFTAEECWMVRPGDTRLPRPERLISDGKTVWSPDGRELDPATGLAGKSSLPGFPPSGGTEGGLPRFLASYPDLDLANSWLVPTGRCPESPLGARDGLSGWRSRRLPEGGFEAETIDGRKVRIRAGAPLLEVEPLGLLKLPGSQVLLSGFNSGFCFFDLEGWPLFFFGMDAPYPAYGLPHLFWNSLTVRDEPASRYLRKLTREQCRLMFEAEDPVPEIVSDGDLRNGVLDTVRFSRRWQDRLTQLLVQRSPDSAPQTTLSEELLQKALYVFATTAGPNTPGAQVPLDDSLEFLRGGRAPARLSQTSLLWWVALPYLKALAFRAAAAYTPETEREVLLLFLETWARLDLAPLPWRVLAVGIERSRLPWPAASEIVGGEYRGSRFLMRYNDFGFALEVAPSGEFQTPPGFHVDADLRPDPWATRERLTEVVNLVRTRGPLPADPALMEKLAARARVPVAMAKLLWAGAPHFHEALPVKLRKKLAIEVEEGIAARENLAHPQVLGTLMGSLMGDEPAQLWKEPATAAPRLARAVKEL